MYSALSTLNTTTEVPLSKAPNPELLPGRCSINGCPVLRVCVLEADIFSGIPRDGKQNRYESRDWNGRGKNLIGSGRDRE